MNKKLLIAWLLLFFLIGCKQRSKHISSSRVPEYDTITYSLFKSGDGWGYDILVNEKVFIHQPFIPAVQGRFAFKSKEDARRAAIFVIEKMMHSGTFPSVKVKELDSLGVLYDTVVRYQEYMKRLNSRKR